MLRRTISQFAIALATLVPLSACAGEAHAEPSAREIAIVVDGGYSPSRIEAKAGETIRLRFVRKDDGPCTRTVEFPSLGISKELERGKETVVELKDLKEGEVAFHCSMKMVKGVVVVAK